jgi:hypothetical protein
MNEEVFRIVNRTAEQSTDDQRPRVGIRSGDKGPRQSLEAAARAQLELRAGRRFSDPEWAAAKKRMVEFVRILRAWHQQTSGDQGQTADVTAMPERLPKAA